MCFVRVYISVPVSVSLIEHQGKEKHGTPFRYGLVSDVELIDLERVNTTPQLQLKKNCMLCSLASSWTASKLKQLFFCRLR